jgi:hypothetical protein
MKFFKFSFVIIITFSTPWLHNFTYKNWFSLFKLFNHQANPRLRYSFVQILFISCVWNWSKVPPMNFSRASIVQTWDPLDANGHLKVQLMISQRLTIGCLLALMGKNWMFQFWFVTIMLAKYWIKIYNWVISCLIFSKTNSNLSTQVIPI